MFVIRVETKQGVREMQDSLHKTFVYFTAASVNKVTILSEEVELMKVAVFASPESADNFALMMKKRKYTPPLSIYLKIFSSVPDTLFLEICMN